MKRLLWSLRLIGMCISMQWRGYINYQGWSALVYGVGQMIGYLGDYLVLFLAIRSFPGAGGFSALEVCFLFGMLLCCYGLAQTVGYAFWRLEDMLLQGDLDRYLVRPVSAVLLIGAQGFNVGYWAHALLGTASMLALKGMLGLVWSPLQWALFPVALLGGALVMAGLSLLPATLAFRWGRAGAVSSFIRFTLKDAANYPLSMYPGWLRHLLFLIPYAAVNYLPCQYLLGHARGPYAFFYALSGLGVGVVWLGLFALAWRSGLRRYESAGG